MKNCELDPAWYYTAPGLAWDTCLKKTGVHLELLSDPDMLLIVVALGPLHDKIRLSPRVLPRRKVPDQKGNEMTSHSNVRESA